MRWFGLSFVPKPKCNRRLARQYRHEPPPEFSLTLPFSGTVHHHSSPNTLSSSTSTIAGGCKCTCPSIHFHCACSTHKHTSTLTYHRQRHKQTDTDKGTQTQTHAETRTKKYKHFFALGDGPGPASIVVEAHCGATRATAGPGQPRPLSSCRKTCFVSFDLLSSHTFL